MKTILRGGTLVTGDGKGRVLQGDLVTDGARIVQIGGKSAGNDRISRVIDATGCAVIPGFVQAHVHLCQVLLRGMADDLPLLDWLKQRIWPLEAAHDETSLRTSAELGLLEMMRAGTTTVLDMGTVHHHEVVLDACVRAGIRAMSGKAMMDQGDGVPKGLRETTRRSLDESDALAKAWEGAGDGRIGYAYAPRFILSCSEKLFRGVAERSRATGRLVHSHVAEHPGERQAVRAVLGDDDLAILRKWGIFGPRAVLAHGVQLTDDEARQVAKEGTRIVHCPSANLKLGSGIARVHELDRFGVVLGIGADGAPCNNNADPWIELRSAALLAKTRSGTTALPAERAFHLATMGGARALGLDAEVGSLEVGKRADLVVVRTDGAHVEPGGDVFSRLVYACTSRDVEHVFVDGAHVVRFGEHQRLDGDRVVRRAREEGSKLSKRAL